MKSKMFPILSSPAKIGNVTLKNRILKAPQSSGMNNKDGTVSERAIRYYSDQAKGGAGAIIVEYAYVDEIGSKSAHCHLGISSDEHIPGLSWLAECIRENGAVPAIQIEHCGRQKFLGTQPICAASALPWPKLWNQYGVQSVPHVLTIEEIQDIVHAFGDAARRAKTAGFEIVEIHGAHGYLLTNFFSPHTNHRTDLYGGSLENRMRIYLEIARDVRKKVGPDMAVTIRLSGTDYEPDGFPIEDTIELAKALEKEGIDAFHISGGDHHTMIHQVSPMAINVCHNVWAAEAIKKHVHVPVIASGSITLPEYAEEILASGKGDFVGLGRPLWADPEWPNKACSDHPEDIRPCIRCNEGCLERYCSATAIIRMGKQILQQHPESMMMEMFGNGITEFSLHRYHYGMEILATKKDVLKITEDLSRDGLFAELKKRKTGWNFCIGYGFGAGIAQARLNALNACHEAELKKNTSYVVTEKEELIGPLGVEATETFMVDNQSYRDIKSKLSPITVSKVMSALEASAEKEITAQELAFRLGVTKRSANRFLSTLEREEILKVAYKKRTTSRGRPESVFVRKEK